jgi:nitric oxide reductase activation protein
MNRQLLQDLPVALMTDFSLSRHSKIPDTRSGLVLA